MYTDPTIGNQKTTRVHSRLIKQVWSRLWYLCRIADKNSKGHVIVNFWQILKLLECNRSTLYRWLEEGKKAGAFRFYQRRGNYLEIYLGSKAKICQKLKLDDWGGVCEMPLKEILSKDFYKRAGQLETAYTQKRSTTAARLNRPRDKKLIKVIYPSELFTHLASLRGTAQASSKLTVTGETLTDWILRKDFKIRTIVNNRYALTRHSFIKIGGTQETTANSLGLTARTIRNHLKEIERVQLCYPIGETEYHRQRFEAAEQWKDPKVFKSSNQFWEYGPNLYDFSEVELISERTARRQFSKFCQNHAAADRNSRLLLRVINKNCCHFKKSLDFKNSSDLKSTTGKENPEVRSMCEL